MSTSAPAGVLTGSARVAQETLERATAQERQQEAERRQYALERKRRMLEAQIAALQADFAAEEDEVQRMMAQDTARQDTIMSATTDDGHSRQQHRMPTSETDSEERRIACRTKVEAYHDETDHGVKSTGNCGSMSRGRRPNR